MTTRHLLPHLQFSVIVLTPFLLAFLLLASFYGCTKQEPAAKQAVVPVTVENMQIAYGKGLKFEHMYHDFEAQAKKERLPLIAQRYRAIARSEAIHAALHAGWLKTQGAEPRTPEIDTVVVGTTLQTLKMALSMEEIETASMYPNLLRTADAENLKDASAQLAAVREADIRHTALLQEVLDKSGRIETTTLFVCPGCGYIETGKRSDCPNCHAPSATLEAVL